MTQIDWKKTLLIMIMIILLIASGKMSGSYEACVLIEEGMNLMRIALSLIILLISVPIMWYYRYALFFKEKQEHDL